jgi:hypothetical protein
MKNKWIKFGVIFILCTGSLMASLLCLGETNITSLLTYHDKGVYSIHFSGPLIANHIIRGEFQATDDNLGMVKLRIRTYNRINTSHIRFQLKEKGAGEWTVNNEYTVDRFPDGLLYPFGFPVISDSKGKVYEFTLESVDGTEDNAIGVAGGYHDVASQYVFQKRELMSDKRQLGMFLTAKAKNIFFDSYAFLYLGIFLTPIIVFLSNRGGSMSALYMGLVYTYLPLSMHSNTILYVAVSVFCITLYSKIASSYVYTLALIFLVQIPLAVMTGKNLAGDRAATLVFFLILIGGIISLTELKKK